MSSSEDFRLTKPRYDLSTYYGRFLHFFEVAEPTNCVIGESKIRSAESAIAKFRETGTMTGTASDMWRYQSIVNGTIHPATGELIPNLFRVSAIAPVNIPLVVHSIVQCVRYSVDSCW